MACCRNGEAAESTQQNKTVQWEEGKKGGKGEKISKTLDIDNRVSGFLPPFFLLQLGASPEYRQFGG
ncbi:hypothetical protein H6P81_012552 [Aristolochia fimbriata]|uniref:Uncharacterized protein n=1 Tax=Aristolochia fimbriata TaxID=158543 RepID=A0AAV7EDQ2_ARIFI|nr:hypothetical protein H6P81_012552 [Aristolochia fimbriata]